MLKANKPRINPITILALSQYEIKRNRLLSVLDIMNPGYTALMIVVESWQRSNKGVTAYFVAMVLNPKENARSKILATRFKLERLVKRGLLEVIGKGYRGAFVYVPTLKALEELDKLL